MSRTEKLIIIILTFTIWMNAASAQEIDNKYSNKGALLIQELALTGSKNADFPERYVFYFKPLTDTNGLYSYMASAGHEITELFANTEIGWTYIRNRVEIHTQNLDLYIGLMVDFRKDMTYFTVDKYRETPQVVYTVREPASSKKPSIQALKKINQPDLDNTRLELCQSNDLVLFQAEIPIQSGFSGAPVVSENGDLLGILIGACTLDMRIYHVTPISTIVKTFNKYLQ